MKKGEMTKRDELAILIGDSKVSDLAWKYCDLNDEENGDYNLELADAIIKWHEQEIVKEKWSSIQHKECKNYCDRIIEQRLEPLRKEWEKGLSDYDKECVMENFDNLWVAIKTVLGE